LALRAPLIHGVLVVLLLAILASPGAVFAAKKMFMQASFNLTQTDRGVSVPLTGRVFEGNNASVTNAVISIQVNNPLNTSIHLAIQYTDLRGVFQDTFLIAADSPAGNYTAFLVADKPGYDTVRTVLIITYSTPDFSIESPAQTMSLQQGQSGSMTVTVLSLRGFNKAVNLTAIDQPPGVNLQFNPTSIIPSGTATANVTVSESVPAGNYTITILGVSGSLSRKASFQLIVAATERPPSDNMFVTWVIVAVVIISVALGLVLRFRARRRRREAALEELIKQAETDTGYVATARVIARLEELRAMGKVDEATYQHLKKEYEKRLEKSK
jgi:hypothetical protein